MSDMSVTRKAALWVGVAVLLGAALAQRNEVARRAQKAQSLTQELELAPEQQKQIEAIIAGVQAQYKAIRQSAEPQVNEARQKGREQIRAILTPEQKPKFEEFLKRLDEERKRREQ